MKKYLTIVLSLSYHVFLIGFIEPFLFSQPDTLLCGAGIVLLVAIPVSLFYTIKYIYKLLKGENINE